ncbi:hypothetical protein [Rhodohalobacter sp. 8-1]|uniref:hypothetical protein n=1 Tax=Rhodohalobacter sp. 8-1 TaxID=3131972 RepID=UPI0030EBB71C
MITKLIKDAILLFTLPLILITCTQMASAQGLSNSGSEYSKLSYLLERPIDIPEYLDAAERDLPDMILIQSNSESNSDRNTTSLTVGYIDDEFLLETDQGSNRFYFNGETAGAMISGKGANLMFAYGSGEAYEGEGEIRSLAGDLSFGGNVHLFRNFLRLPLNIYIPIRLNAGYRNLALTEEDETLHLAQAGIGAGAGASVRIPTGLPLLRDNLTGFASLVRSVGGMGDISSTIAEQSGADEMSVLSGVRLMQNTDLNIEAKFERLLGDNTGVTVGMTIRWQSWTEEKADEFLQIIDVITGEQENLIERGQQTFLRVGINW